MSLPVACSLTDSELQEGRLGVLQKVRSAVVEVRELHNGYAYSFPVDGDWLTELAKLVELERQCCPFLGFRITVESGSGSIWFEMQGPHGTKNFLATTFSSESLF